ncbi:serine hydrolase domain-containing protein [Glutamicibacter uratoxydans]|uniref:serine hydrolase domain-containing protein n=1 Tax=Glutamicibacter uratoxydans TaxID=43667 RepID=UPI003D6F3D12
MTTAKPKDPITVENWQHQDNLRWSFQNLSSILPTSPVSRGGEPTAKLHMMQMDLGSIELIEKHENEPSLTVRSVIQATNTDGWLVMHRGKVLVEEYFGTMNSVTDHLLMSVSKTLVGTVAGILNELGKLDLNLPITHYVPELATSGYAGATTRHLLDMRSGIKFSEEYMDPQAEVRLLEQAIGWAVREDTNPNPAQGMYEYLATLQAKTEHGGPFEYRSCETDALGWVCERAGGKKMQELLSELIWSQIGAQQDLVMGTDQFDVGMFDGGFNATLRDLARFGWIYVNKGVALNGKKIIDEAWITDTFTGDPDSRQAFEDSPGDNRMPGGMYRNQIWFPYPGSDVALALGIHGQMIYMNPNTNTVGVKLSSWPYPQDPGRLFPTIRAFDAIANHLAATQPA